MTDASLAAARLRYYRALDAVCEEHHEHDGVIRGETILAMERAFLAYNDALSAWARGDRPATSEERC